jgi:Uma2 family endonuclease
LQTTQLVSPGEYLATVYEPDAELVDGVIEERPMGEKDHGKWQLAIQLWFAQHREAWGVEVYPEVRVQTGASNYRVPDVLVLDADAPDEQIITHPPLAVFEILSPEDRVQRVMRKLQDYASMGIAGIYLVDPQTGAFQRFEHGDLLKVEECSVGSQRFPVSEIARLVR